MNKFVVFLLGLIVGAGAIWLYSASVLVPTAAEEARVELSKIVEADKQAQELFVTGVVAAADELTGTITLEIASALESTTEEATTITVTTDANTTFRTVDNSPVTIVGLTVGSRVTVISNEAIGTRTSIYAKEIVQL